MELLCTKGDDGILTGGDAAGDQAGDEGQEHGERHEDQPGERGKGGDIRDTGQAAEDQVRDDGQEQGHQDADDAGGEAHDERLGVKDPGHIPAGGADGPQDADLLGALQHADVGDDPDHNGGNDKGDADKGNEHIADDIRDGDHGGHEQAHIIRIGDRLAGFGIFVILRDQISDPLLGLKILRVDIDGGRTVRIADAEGGQVLLIGVAADHHGALLDELPEQFLGQERLIGIRDHAGGDEAFLFHEGKKLRHLHVVQEVHGIHGYGAEDLAGKDIDIGMFKLFLHDLAVSDLLQEVIRELPAIADSAAHGGDNGALGRRLS